MFGWSSFGKAVDLLILSSWDLDNFSLQLIYPSPYLVQISLHSFTSALIDPVYLVSDDLRVIVKDHSCGSYCFGEIKPCHEGFILYFIIGGREVEVDHTLNLVSFRRKKYNTNTSSLPIGRPVCMYTPLRVFICPLVFLVSKLCYKVSNDLPFNGGAWVVLNVKLT